MIVDSHVHVVSADRERYPLSPLAPGRMSAWVVERPATAEALRGEMDRAGIARAVLVHSTSAYGFENGYESDVAAADPDRFTAVGGIDVAALDAPRRMRYWIGERGLVGLRIYAAGAAVENDDATLLDDPRSFPAWETAAELRIPLIVNIRFHALPRLARMLERFPTVPVILDNLASPPLGDGPPYAAAEPLLHLARHPQLTLKVTSSLLLRDHARGGGHLRAYLERAIADFGADRVMWGSNFPGSAGTLPELRSRAEHLFAGFPSAVRAEIFSGVALRMFFPRLASGRNSKTMS
jgi:L-fuconolactonase